MTLEFENPPFLSNIGLNSSYNNEADFTAFDHQVTSKAKKTSVISVTRKESLFAEGKIQESGKMSGRYSDDNDSYEDDFDSPSPTKEPSRRYSRSSRRTHMSERDRSPSSSPPKYQSRSKKASSRRDSFASYRGTYGANRGRAKPKSKKSQSATSKMTAKTTGGEGSMMRRVLSANRHKVSRLHNVMEELQVEVDELKSENKSLKRVSHRQEKEIKKIDDEEASLPMLLQRHSAEMRTLKNRLRKNQEILHGKDKESRHTDREIQKLRDKVKSYRELSQDRKLEERAALAKKLENIENEMTIKDKKILDLEKAITLKDKARQREMKDQKDRYRQAKEELKRVQEDFRSLCERLQEKEKQLDEKNIYHQHITTQKKKGEHLPALPAASHVPAIAAPVIHAEKPANAKEKRTNVFLTNALSDSGSAITDEGGRSLRSDVRQEKPGGSEAAQAVPVEADSRGKDEEDRLRREAEQRRRLEEEERRRRVEEENRKRREEEERRMKQEQDRLNKQREEDERARKQKEEEERLRFEEDAEIRRKKDLLLARMRAIDGGNDKPNIDTTAGFAADPPVENKPQKLPIFLQNEKPEPQEAKPTKSLASNDDIFSNASGDGKKHSSARSKQSGYSYEYKQTVENLHHGLPAHASLESVKNESTKADVKDSLSDDLSFGSYKPTLGRRAAAKRENKDKDELSFGGYNPSFVAKKDTARKDSGLDFGAGKKVAPAEEQNGVIFGDYKPALGDAPSKPASNQQNGDIFGERSSPVRSRRPRGLAGNEASVFGDDLLTNEEAKPIGNPLFGDKSFNKDKSSYPWENKVNVTRRSSEEDSLLPRRKHLQSFGKSTEKNVRAVDNALDDVDDDIEEVIL